MNKLRDVGTKFTEHTCTYSKDYNNEQVEVKYYKHTFEVIGHTEDLLGYQEEILKPISSESSIMPW